MTLVDGNLLIYSFVRDLPQHPAACRWLENELVSSNGIALPWTSLLAFVRVATNPRIFKAPVTVAQAWAQVERWLSSPVVTTPNPSERHAEILGRLLLLDQMHSKAVPDAHLAALAIEHDLTLYSSDGGFRRYPGLKWRNPLATA